MANIFFIHRFPFNKEAFIRDEFEHFIGLGYNVKYLEISHLLKKKNLGTTCPESLKKHIIRFSNRKSFADFLSAHQENSIIVTDVGLLANSAWMYLAIFKSKLPYVLFENSVLPKIKNARTISVKTIGILKFLKRLNFRKVYIKPFEMVQYYWALLSLNSAEMIITSKPKLSSEKKVLKGSNSLMKYSMSLDYKVAENVSEEPLLDHEYVVFVDQYFIHHPDFKTNHIIHSFTAEQYYSELNNFLSRFSKQTGLKVVIASHPRRNDEQKKDFNPEFELYYNQTANLIKYSKLVLLHFSTAINFAVIFHKPFVLLDSNLFQNSSIQEYLMMFANYFCAKPLNMGNSKLVFDIHELLKVDEEIYTAFLHHYIKHPKATDETFKDQITITLKNLSLDNK